MKFLHKKRKYAYHGEMGEHHTKGKCFILSAEVRAGCCGWRWNFYYYESEEAAREDGWY